MRSRSLKAVLTTLVAFAALATTAWGYFSTTGTGSGSGSLIVSRALTISTTEGVKGATLMPTGQRTGSVYVRLANGTSGDLRVNRLVLDTTRGSAGYSPAAVGCNLGYVAQTNGGSGWNVPANSSIDVELQNSVLMGTDAPSSCQGQAFALYLKTT
jgi:hypothetical protein